MLNALSNQVLAAKLAANAWLDRRFKNQGGKLYTTMNISIRLVDWQESAEGYELIILVLPQTREKSILKNANLPDAHIVISMGNKLYYRRQPSLQNYR